MKYEKLLKQFDLPNWLIDNLDCLSDEMFLLWLQDNIVKLYEISLEFRDMASQLGNYCSNYLPFEDEWNGDASWPF